MLCVTDADLVLQGTSFLLRTAYQVVDMLNIGIRIYLGEKNSVDILNLPQAFMLLEICNRVVTK